MPDVSRAQQRAMHAAEEGKSTLGIPQSVGAEFVAADHARGPAKLPERKEHPASHKSSRFNAYKSRFAFKDK